MNKEVTKFKALLQDDKISHAYAIELLSDSFSEIKRTVNHVNSNSELLAFNEEVTRLNNFIKDKKSIEKCVLIVQNETEFLKNLLINDNQFDENEEYLKDLLFS